MARQHLSWKNGKYLGRNGWVGYSIIDKILTCRFNRFFLYLSRFNSDHSIITVNEQKLGRCKLGILPMKVFFFKFSQAEKKEFITAAIAALKLNAYSTSNLEIY